jgi:tetratricopeptide (TPR) repeat protein
LALGQTGKFDEGNKLYEKGIGLAREVDDLHSLSLLELNHGVAHNIRGENKAAIEHLQKCVQLCEKGRITIYMGLAWSGLGWSYTLLGKTESALKHIQKGIELHLSAEAPYMQSLHYLLLSAAHHDSGDLSSAIEAIEKARQHARQIGEKWIEGLSMIFYGRFLGKFAKEHHQRAETLINQGIGITIELKMRPYHAQGLLMLAEFYLFSGKRLRALPYLLKARKIFKELKMDYWLEISKQSHNIE